MKNQQNRSNKNFLYKLFRVFRLNESSSRVLRKGENMAETHDDVNLKNELNKHLT